MDDQKQPALPDQTRLNPGPQPHPQPGTAAEAFARLGERVEAIDGRLAVMARALEHIAAEKQDNKGPDYSDTLLKLNGNLADLAKAMKAVQQSDALKLTPDSFADEIIVAAEDARAADKAAIKELRALLGQSIVASNATIGTVRAKRDQDRHMLYTGIGSALAVLLLWLFCPGWAAGIAPHSWNWPEQVARRTMGKPTLWDAGIHMMQAGNPAGWQAIVDAVDMQQANREIIAACEQQAKKAKEPVRCTIRMGRPKD